MSAICPCRRSRAGQCCACSGSCPTESSSVSPCLTVTSWHVQNESVIDSPQIVWIGGDHMQVALPRADRNRDIDDIGVARPPAQQADSPGHRVLHAAHPGTPLPPHPPDPPPPPSPPPPP